MLRLVAVDRVLILGSAVWLCALWLAPALHAEPAAFVVSSALIAGNAAFSLKTLTRTRRICIGLNLMQIALFGVLNWQLAGAFGGDHYRYDRPPRFYDWAEFTFAHVLRAADVLDALDDYGPIQTITHNSTASGILLIVMHLTVDVFLVGLALRWARRFWGEPAHETRLQQERREFGWLLSALALFVLFGLAQNLSLSDWFLWPIDNLLRLIDVGDVLQVFGWRLHTVEANSWTRGAGLIFRLAAGIWMARFVILWRLTVFRAWGVSLEELTELLDDAAPQVRRNAAIGLGQSGPAAHRAVPALMEALRDLNPLVRCAAAQALGAIGPAAECAVDLLIQAAWLGRPELRLASIESLGRIGRPARSALSSLLFLLKVSDASTRPVIADAIERITPGLLRVLTTPRQCSDIRNDDLTEHVDHGGCL